MTPRYEQPAEWCTAWANYTGPAIVVMDDTSVEEVHVIDSSVNIDPSVAALQVRNERSETSWHHPRYVHPRTA